uniref:FLYWCH-type domain-containing protein n=1 Tax=Octopus bimaculoides TaxID=37653 RepID=A0A0L8FH09_OCTBM
MPHVFNSIRGGKKLVDDMNYIYEMQKKNADGSKTYWKCEIRSCKARVHTMTRDEYYTILKRVGEHLHNSCASMPKVRKTLADLKAQAAASQESSRSLIATICEKLDENEMALMPPSSYVSRNIRNWRQAKVSGPPNPLRVDLVLLYLYSTFWGFFPNIEGEIDWQSNYRSQNTGYQITG